ncbi:MAG: methyltransferase domain-containing protein [Dehalococcoidia bacterium]|nr:methyltransferase domain-containing protein [Dehalococcoidia bacterium]MYA51874.1 methyltransferase domain-containing protein [Dehalococcoidia bacterium]
MSADPPEDNPLLPEHFRRVDESDDSLFYVQPRLVNHIDDEAIAALGDFYRETFPEGGHLLDLMSSWVSHLPADVTYGGVTGLGMNKAELEANPVLTRRTLHDLNQDPVLPYDADEFDGAIISVSVQYLTRPVEVFAEVGRVLKPGAPFAITFSNRMFPTKAVRIWQLFGDEQRANLVALYFELSKAFAKARAFDLSPAPFRSDPVYAVVAEALDPSVDSESTGIT